MPHLNQRPECICWCHPEILWKKGEKLRSASCEHCTKSITSEAPKRPEWETQFDEKFEQLQFLGVHYFPSVKGIEEEHGCMEKCRADGQIKDFITTLLLTEHARWVAEARKKLVGMLANWSDFTCHTREEHATNDCPGFSHEDQRIRGVILEQLEHHIKNLPFLSQETNV